MVRMYRVEVFSDPNTAWLYGEFKKLGEAKELFERLNVGGKARLQVLGLYGAILHRGWTIDPCIFEMAFKGSNLNGH